MSSSQPLILLGGNLVVKITKMENSDLFRFGDGEYIERMTLALHLQMMKLLTSIAAHAFIAPMKTLLPSYAACN
jgi:hypothetical protein